MKAQLTLLPSISINPRVLACYNQVDWQPVRPEKKFDQQKNAYFSPTFDHLLNSARSAQGNVSKIAKRKMNRSLDYLLLMANEKQVDIQTTGRKLKFKIAFITLTLPSKQIHSDNQIKNECLNQFLIELKKYYHVRNYLWRAEKQKNGNLHFHIIVDKFIPFQELRDRWNRIINKLGYVDRYRDNMQTFYANGFRPHQNLLRTWPLKKQIAAYERGARTHWSSPNSTDVHSVQRIRDVRSYISKYITKNEVKQVILRVQELAGFRKEHPNRVCKKPVKNKKQLLRNRRNRQLSVKKAKQTGRIWGCNQELSKIKGAQALVDNQLQQEIDTIFTATDIKTFSDTYFRVAYFDITLLKKYPQSRLFQIFSQYLFEQFNFSFQTELAT
jgi:hypothetical protein